MPMGTHPSLRVFAKQVLLFLHRFSIYICLVFFSKKFPKIYSAVLGTGSIGGS